MSIWVKKPNIRTRIKVRPGIQIKHELSVQIRTESSLSPIGKFNSYCVKREVRGIKLGEMRVDITMEFRKERCFEAVENSSVSINVTRNLDSDSILFYLTFNRVIKLNNLISYSLVTYFSIEKFLFSYKNVFGEILASED